MTFEERVMLTVLLQPSALFSGKSESFRTIALRDRDIRKCYRGRLLDVNSQEVLSATQ